MSRAPGKARLFFEQLGPVLALYRRRCGLSGAALAVLAQTGKSQLSKYESGKELPKLETLARILDSLGIEPIGFFYTAHQMSSRTPDIETALALDLVSAPPTGLLSPQEEAGFQRVLADLLILHRVTLEARVGAIGKTSSEKARPGNRISEEAAG